MTYTTESLRYHLQCNVVQQLTEQAINGIISAYNRIVDGECSLDDTVPESVNSPEPFTYGEMMEDLHIELPESHFDYINS